MTAVIIAGGKGTRLAPYTKDMPKPMLQIKGKPILEHQIAVFKRYGVADIILTVGYRKEAIKDYFGDGKNFGVHIRYAEEAEPLGSAGALFYVKNMAVESEPLYLAYGDVLFDVCLPRMMEFHKTHGRDATIAVHPNSHPLDSDLVLRDENNIVQGFLSKNGDRTGKFYHNCVNAGLFIVNRSALEDFERPEKKDFEKDFLKHLISKRQAVAYATSEYIHDMGTPKRLAQVERDMERGILKERNLEHPQKCVFLDRDGTINVWKGLISSPDYMELEEHSAEGIREINDSGYLAIAVTNQPVIARGLCTLEDLTKIHQKLEMLLGEQGAYLDAVYFCPHHPDKGYEGERKEYKISCNCRKPGTGMVTQAAKDFNIDLGQSWIVGDSTRDIQTGKNAGMKTILLKTGEGGKDGKYPAEPDERCADLRAAVDCILHRKE